MFNQNSGAANSSALMRYFPAAPWSAALKLSSFLGAILLLGVGIAAVNAIPQNPRVPYAAALGTVVAFAPPIFGLARFHSAAFVQAIHSQFPNIQIESAI